MAGRGKQKRPTLTPGWVTYGRTSSEEAQAPERSLDSQRRLNLERLIEGTGLPLSLIHIRRGRRIETDR